MTDEEEKEEITVEINIGTVSVGVDEVNFMVGGVETSATAAEVVLAQVFIQKLRALGLHMPNMTLQQLGYMIESLDDSAYWGYVQCADCGEEIEFDTRRLVFDEEQRSWLCEQCADAANLGEAPEIMEEGETPSITPPVPKNTPENIDIIPPRGPAKGVLVFGTKGIDEDVPTCAECGAELEEKDQDCPVCLAEQEKDDDDE